MALILELANKTLHDPVALFTAFVAIFTAVLVWVGYVQSKALPRIEKAYVFVEVKLEESLTSTPSGNALSPVAIYYRNEGNTPAVIRKLRAYAAIQKEPPQELHKFPGSEDPVPPGLAIAGHGYYRGTVYCRVSDLDTGEMERGNKTLFIVGLIEYEDVLRSKRKTSFCWHYSQHGASRGNFIISPNTRLNHYTK